MTSRRQQRDNAPDPFDAARLERELHQSSRGKNREGRRPRPTTEAEAAGFARVTGKHYRTRPTGEAS